MKKAFIPIWFATALAAFALTDECDLLCDETFWKTATTSPSQRTTASPPFAA